MDFDDRNSILNAFLNASGVTRPIVQMQVNDITGQYLHYYEVIYDKGNRGIFPPRHDLETMVQESASGYLLCPSIHLQWS